MSAPRFRSPLLHARPQEHGTDPVEVNPPAGLDRVDHPDECGTWLVVLVLVAGGMVLYLAVHIVVAFFRLVAS